MLSTEVGYGDDLEPFFKQWTSLYAATEEKHDAANCPVPADKLLSARGIEVGQVFFLGNKYTKAMNVSVAGPNGEAIVPEMGCYGIGVSRLVGAIIEASHDDAGIIWPAGVAPFGAGLINLRAGDAACTEASDALYATLNKAGIDTLYDDRDESAGRQIRRDGSDRPAVADRGRAARPAKGRGRGEEPRAPASARR